MESLPWIYFSLTNSSNNQFKIDTTFLLFPTYQVKYVFTDLYSNQKYYYYYKLKVKIKDVAFTICHNKKDN